MFILAIFAGYGLLAYYYLRYGGPHTQDVARARPPGYRPSYAETRSLGSSANPNDRFIRPRAKGAASDCTEEVAYWLNFPDDAAPRLPDPRAMGLDPGVTKDSGRYVTFETDHGGWNNIRMAFEAVAVFALVTRRTLVMPPAQFLYLLNKDSQGKNNKLGVRDIFDMEDLGKHLDVITMEEFLQREKVDTGGKDYKDLWGRHLWPMLREIVDFTPKWSPDKYCLWFGDEASANSTRAKQFCSDKREVIRYVDDPGAKVIHFRTEPENGYRMLTHFYTFLGFQDPSVDRSVKRWARRFMHYKSEIVCAAGKLQRILRDKIGARHYASYHIRRGDLQYAVVKIPAEEIVENIRDVVPAGIPAYVGTDERDKSFFDKLKAFHGGQLYFLDDLIEEAGSDFELSPNYYGMMEQLLCAGGSTFVGTHFSTFSGYIARLRGYRKWPSKSNYYPTKAHKYKYHPDKMPRRAHPVWYPREWPTSWERLDVDTETQPRPDMTTDDDQWFE